MPNDQQTRIDSLTQAIERMQAELAASKKAEAALRESEALYRSIFDYTAIGLAQVSADGRFAEINRSFCDILGYSRDELLSMADLDLTHPDDRQMDKKQRKRILAGETRSAIWEKRYIRKDGSVVWTSLNLAVAHQARGKPKFLMAAMENINERKMLQESLGRIRSDLTKAEVMSLAGTWKLNLRTNEVTASEEIFHLFALAPSRLPVSISPFLERVAPESRPSVDQMLQAAASGQKSFQLECYLKLTVRSRRLI